MEFKQYPSYKNSGVEWLGDVPEHWVGSKFKYIFHSSTRKLPELTTSLAKQEKLIKQKSLIEKLKEYRASIISHAVTGKIDVREFGA
jgi:hypothetical protein